MYRCVAITCVALLVQFCGSLYAQQTDEQKYAKIDAFAVTVDGSTIEEVTQKLITPYKSDPERFRALFRWVSVKIAYDVSGYLGKSPMTFMPAEVFSTRLAVCSGYSRLLQRMCNIAGIECVGVTGMARSDARDTTYSTNHEWVAVKLDTWKLADPTWAAGSVDFSNDTFVRKFNSFYYFPDPALFILSHYPQESKWQLLSRPVPKAEFLKQVFLTKTFFEKGYKLISPTRQDTCFQNVLPVIVKGTLPMLSYFSWEIDQYGEAHGIEPLAYGNDDGTFTFELKATKNAYYAFDVNGLYVNSAHGNSVDFDTESLMLLRAFGYNDQLAATFNKLNLKTCRQKIEFFYDLNRNRTDKE